MLIGARVQDAMGVSYEASATMHIGQLDVSEEALGLLMAGVPAEPAAVPA